MRCALPFRLIGLWSSLLHAVALTSLVVPDDLRAQTAAEPPITDSDREHWSFQPVERSTPPQVNDAGWCRTPVDRFIFAELEEHSLQPMPQADPLTLLRRVTFDLSGLPPTPQEIDAFLGDEDGGAYGRLVDRLLASPAYGQRWAQHWLDLARFAETDGFEHDNLRPNAWRYRDWIIEALNEDLSYADFVRLQLAGDELQPDDPRGAIATGFLLCGPDMPDINLQQERRHNFLNDMAGTVSAVFLGLQMQCASCHDHKFDPISQRDFYRLRAFFDPAEVFGEHEIPTAQERAAVEAFEQHRAQRWKSIEAELAGLRNEESAAARSRTRKLGVELDALKKLEPPATTLARSVANPRPSADAEPSRLWVRGDFRRPGEELEPAFVRVVNPQGLAVSQQGGPAPVAGRRTALAGWLVATDHPLTARVMVNRLWQHHFGRGIVGTASDFGFMGDRPTHPELLDWLAAEFIDSGWSLKHMHRLLVTSSVYRTQSRPSGAADSPSRARWERLVQDDARNKYLGRMRRRRLEGEALRDSLLSSTGLLNREAGGPGVRPPLSAEVTNTLLKNQWPVTEDEAAYRRRSIWLFVRRNLPYPLFAAFDRPDSNQSCPQRNETTIAPQALQLLNSDFSFSCAEALAARLVKECGDDLTAQIHRGYLLTLSRPPSVEERETARRFLSEGSSESLTDFCLALVNLNEFVYID